jgi:hypothetical protein
MPVSAQMLSFEIFEFISHERVGIVGIARLGQGILIAQAALSPSPGKVFHG